MEFSSIIVNQALPKERDIFSEELSPLLMKRYWENIYASFDQEPPSWLQLRPSPSLDWIQEFLPYRKVRIIDVGGGASVLVDHLLSAGYQRPMVLDISGNALAIAQARLGEKKDLAQWVEADVTLYRAVQPFSLWHDRGLFHHLMDRSSRMAYGHTLWNALLPGGLALIATYAVGESAECTGLPVRGYDAAALCAELGPAFQLRISKPILHLGPGGERREFTYALFEKK